MSNNNQIFRSSVSLIGSTLLNCIIAADVLSIDLPVYLLLVANGSIVLYNLITSVQTQQISLKFFVSFFFYLFFFIVPSIHYHHNYFNYFFDGKSTIGYARYSLILQLIFNILISSGNNRFSPQIRNLQILFTGIFISKGNRYSTWLFIMLCFLVALSVGLDTLLLRGNSFAKTASESMLKVMAFSFFFRPLVFFVTILEFKKRRHSTMVYQLDFIILVMCAIAFNLPSATARFYTLFIFIVFISAVFMKKTTSKLLIPLILTIGVNFSFFFSSLRFLNSIDELNVNDVGVLDTRSFINSIHFDAFEVSMLSLKYVEKEDFTYGNNILGTIFFFVPRSMWNDKPEPSGFLIINNQINSKLLEDENFTNISFPLISEFYIAFGFLGVILLSLLLRRFIKTLDFILKKSFLNQTKALTHYDLNIIFISTIIGLSTFILRGTLMVAYSYSFSIIVSFFVALRITNIKYKFRI